MKKNGPTFVVRNVDGVARVDVYAQDCEEKPTAADVEAIRIAAQADIDAHPELWNARPDVREIVEEVKARLLGRETPTYSPPPRNTASRTGENWVFRNKLRDAKRKRKRLRSR